MGWAEIRMSFWPNLGRTYQATHDEQYAVTFAKHLRSWSEQCPRPADSGNVPESCWRTIESGIRMARSWPETYHLFLDSPSFTDSDILLYLKLCIEHGRHLRTHHRERGNWLAMEMAGLYTIGAVFPELREAAAWRHYAIDKAYAELNIQFMYPIIGDHPVAGPRMAICCDDNHFAGQVLMRKEYRLLGAEDLR